MCLESLKQSGLHEIDGLLKYRVYATIRYEFTRLFWREITKNSMNFVWIIEINRCIISNYSVKLVLSEKEFPKEQKFPTILFLERIPLSSTEWVVQSTEISATTQTDFESQKLKSKRL